MLLSSVGVQRFLSLSIGFLAVAFFAIACFVEAAHFSQLAALFLRLPPTSDSQLYLAMARGWLNGFHFYRDLFETKPPGVFLVAALAMRMGGGFPLYVGFQLALLTLLGPLLGVYAYVSLGRAPRMLKWLGVGVSTLLGMTIAVTALSQTIGFQAEGFALLFATLAVLLFAMPASDRHRLIVDLLARASLALASMFKEPFFASGLLGILVFTRSRNDAYRLLRVIAAAGIVGVMILILSGAFADYVTLYLPEIIAGRATNSIIYPDFGARLYFVIAAPTWVRMLNVYKFFTAVGSSPVPALLLPAFFGACVCLWAPLRTDDRRMSAFLASAALFIAVVIVGHQFFLLYELVAALHAIGKDVPWHDAIIVRLLTTSVGAPIVFAIVIAMMPHRFRPTFRLGIESAAAVLWMLLVSGLVAWSGDFTSKTGPGEYLVFAFPPLLSLAAYCVGRLVAGRRRLALGLLGLVLVANAVMPSDYGKVASLLAKLAASARSFKQPAADLDAVLSGCKETRYLVASPELQALPAFTTHSPYQISYGAARSIGGLYLTSTNTTPNAYLAAKFKQDLASTRIIVATQGADVTVSHALSGSSTEGATVLTMDPIPGMATSPIALPIAEALRENFTTRAPGCARGRVPIPGLQLFFRNR